MNTEQQTEKDQEQTVEETTDETTAEETEEMENVSCETEETADDKIAALTDRLMRTAAEFDNYKKRTLREKDEYFKTAVCDTVAQILPVLDNLERATAAAEENPDSASLLEGVKMIEKQLKDALSGIGVTEIPAVGEMFDPERHNAVMTEESDQAENTVLEQFMKGYSYKDKVVRHSMVKVAN